MLLSPPNIQKINAAEVSNTDTTITEQSLTTTQINNRYSAIEKKVRNAAVKVTTSTGHGSGTLIRFKGMDLIITARHVADGTLGQSYILRTESEQRSAILIYSDPLNDIAILYPTMRFNHASPMKWKVLAEISDVGQNITYSGYPSWHNLLSFRGQISGYELLPGKGQQIILQTYGYFGSSGSGVYDTSGNLVGILWAIDSQREGVHENIVWVSPIQNLDIKLALDPFCRSMANEPKACR